MTSRIRNIISGNEVSKDPFGPVSPSSRRETRSHLKPFRISRQAGRIDGERNGGNDIKVKRYRDVAHSAEEIERALNIFSLLSSPSAAHYVA